MSSFTHLVFKTCRSRKAETLQDIFNWVFEALWPPEVKAESLGAIASKPVLMNDPNTLFPLACPGFWVATGDVPRREKTESK